MWDPWGCRIAIWGEGGKGLPSDCKCWILPLIQWVEGDMPAAEACQLSEC